MIERRFIGVDDLARYLDLSKNTVRAWVRTGKIPFSKMGRLVKFDLQKIDPWLKNKECPYTKKVFG